MSCDLSVKSYPLREGNDATERAAQGKKQNRCELHAYIHGINWTCGPAGYGSSSRLPNRRYDLPE